jgi:aspartate/methionine/tyrosine aminotransferase
MDVSAAFRFAGRAVHTPSSGIREIVHRALALEQNGRDVIRLEVGEASAGTGHAIVDSAFAEARAGRTRYTASAGDADLRRALAAKLASVNGINVSEQHIVVTVGAVQGLWLALSILCDPEGEVLVPNPGWPNYEMIATMIGARARRYPCGPTTSFLPDLPALRTAVGPGTRVIVVNSPHNPSGAVYPAPVVREIKTIAAERGVTIVSDEAYDELFFESRPVSPGRDVPVDAGTWVAVFSFSKTYAMTGWRVGYLVASTAVTELAAKLQEPTVSCVSSVAQRAALAALTGSQEGVAAQRAWLRARRDQVLARLRAAGRATYTPQGAFYLLIDVRPHDDRQFALSLLEEKGVAVAPGSAFGDAAQGFVRICYAAGGERLMEGVDRLLAAI